MHVWRSLKITLHTHTHIPRRRGGRAGEQPAWTRRLQLGGKCGWTPPMHRPAGATDASACAQVRARPRAEKADCRRVAICLGSPPGSWHLGLPSLSAHGQTPAEPLGGMRSGAQPSSSTPDSPSVTLLPSAKPGPAPPEKH